MSKKRNQGTGRKPAARKKNRVLQIAVYLMLLAVIGLFGRAAYSLGYEVFCQEPMSSEAEARDVEVIVQDGMSVYQIGRLLRSKGLIDSPLIFWVQEELSDYRGKIRSGQYVLSTAQTPDEMIAVMAAQPEEEDA